MNTNLFLSFYGNQNTHRQTGSSIGHGPADNNTNESLALLDYSPDDVNRCVFGLMLLLQDKQEAKKIKRKNISRSKGDALKAHIGI